MEEKKYTVMSDDNGKIYVYMGEDTREYPPDFPEFLKFQSIQRVNDPHNWEVGELVSDSDIEFLTGSGWIRRRVL
jgi:hypothetical protein